MSAWLEQHEGLIRLTAFLALIAVLLLAEHLWPRREVPGGWRRRLTNFGLVALYTLVLRLAFPLLAVGMALLVEERRIGLLQAVTLPGWLAIVIGVLLLDVAIYWQHRLLHMIPLLWRLHRVHHADLGFDFSTGVRFHPIEIALSMAIKLGLIALLGIGPLAVLIFELALSLGSLFTHANLRLPAALDRSLRWVVVTPDMHRVHHSWHRDETDSNYGFHLSVWDRLFRSYRNQPRDGHEGMTIGLPYFREAREQNLWSLLLNPFRPQPRSVVETRSHETVP